MLRRLPAEEAPFFAANRVNSASFIVGAQATRTRNVAVQLLDPSDRALQEYGSVDAFLATDAHGQALATAPSSGVAIGTHGLLVTQITNVAWKMVSDGSGRIDVNITDASTQNYYLVLVMPSGNLVVSPVIALS